MPKSSNWPKVLIDAKRASEKHGWQWRRASNGHYNVFTPDGVFVVSISGTFYDGPLTRKYLGRLRKAGCPGVPQ